MSSCAKGSCGTRFVGVGPRSLVTLGSLASREGTAQLTTTAATCRRCTAPVSGDASACACGALDPALRGRRVSTAALERERRLNREARATAGLTIDHVHPLSLGGTNEDGNLQTLCRSCNSRKGAHLD